jgi:hypothetical protein
MAANIQDPPRQHVTLQLSQVTAERMHPADTLLLVTLVHDRFVGLDDLRRRRHWTLKDELAALALHDWATETVCIARTGVDIRGRMVSVGTIYPGGIKLAHVPPTTQVAGDNLGIVQCGWQPKLSSHSWPL